MPKGQAPKMKCAICNVPLEAEDVCDVLPRGADSNGILYVKLKRKMMYNGHEYFDSVRRHIVKEVLEYLKKYNPLYQNIIIDDSKLTDGSCNFQSDQDDSEMPEANEEVEQENPLDAYRTAATETVLISKVPVQIVDNENITIAPCQGKKPMSILSDNYCEELSHPYLFPTGKFGYKVERDVKLSPSKYFNQRLLNYKQSFASEAEYIFFAH